MKLVHLIAAAFVAAAGMFAGPRADAALLQYDLAGPNTASFVLDMDPTAYGGFVAESNRFELQNFDAGPGAFPTNTPDNLGTLRFFLSDIGGGFNLSDITAPDAGLKINSFGPQLFSVRHPRRRC